MFAVHDWREYRVGDRAQALCYDREVFDGTPVVDIKSASTRAVVDRDLKQ
jgi:tRNA (Thr-GGU) A37 N-methylase